MNILWLAPYPRTCDGSVHPAPWITSLASAVSRQNDVSLTILNYASELENDEVSYKQDAINFIFLKVPSQRYDTFTLYQNRIRKIRAYLNRIVHNYDLIHIHGSEHQYEVVTYDMNIPQVVSMQGIISECVKILPKNNIKKYLRWLLAGYYEKAYLKKIEAFSCRTHWDKKFVTKLNPNARIYENWELIRPEFFSPPSPRNKNSSSILFPGGTSVIKGYKEMLQAVNVVRQQVDLKLIMIGNTNKEQVLNFIDEKGLSHVKEKDIDFRGFQDASGVVEAYQDSFCMVHPTYIDNSPNSVCEAQIYGLPVIATNVGGVSSLIEDGVTGMLVDLDVGQIAESIIKLFFEHSFTRQISENARKIARARHCEQTIINKTIAMYRDLITN